MFIPTKSDGQISVNLRKTNIREKKIKIILSSPCSLCSLSVFYFCCLLFVFYFVFFFSLSETHISFFLPFSIRFSSETIYFFPISISFILIEYSLHIFHFSEFFKNLVFRFHSIFVAYKFVKYSDCLRIQRNFSRSLDFARRT